MSSSSNTQKKISDRDYLLALEIIAANTMCTRKAVDVAARIGKTLIISTVAITIATIVLLNTSVNPENTSLVIVICWGVIIVFALFTVIYSLSLLAEVNRTTELVAEKEEPIFNDEKDKE